ncbi:MULTISPECIES: hypothetical protein [Methylocystis]|uniref:hypothetical protein n=1 Tax=Methylocystis TaxID=133 RepID=UPI0024BBE66D|nr:MULTISPECIES: hypothetical protein [Methylocystis]MDJ0450950.1 hypothetical protein [Methylocystis sp. JR02]
MSFTDDLAGVRLTQWSERALSEAVVVMRADEIHPMRFVRQLPKEAWPFIRHAARNFSQGLMTGDEFQSVVDFTANIYNRALEKIAFEQRPETSDILVSLSSTIAHLIPFTAAGRNSFLIDRNLISLLGKTDLGDIRLGDIKLPFRAFYLGFEGGLGFGLPGAPNIIDGAYVEHYVGKNDPAERLTFYITSRQRDETQRKHGSWIVNHEPHFFAPLSLDNPEQTLEAAMVLAVATRDIALQPDEEAIDRLQHGVQVAREEGVSIGVPSVTGYQRKALFNEEAIPTAKSVISLICNALCLLSAEPQNSHAEWPDDAPKTLVDSATNATTAKRQKTAAGQLAETGFFAVHRVSLNRDSPYQRENDPELAASQEVATHWRRGHWRRQAHGPNLVDRRLIWIRPTLVRSDQGHPEKGRIYTVHS